MENVMKNKDQAPTEDDIQDSQSEKGSQTEDENETEEWVACDGFTDEQGQIACKRGHTEKEDHFHPCLMYKVASGGVKHFCKPSHLMRYLIKFHTAKGKEKSKKNSSNEHHTTTNTQDNTSQPSSSSLSTRGRGGRRGSGGHGSSGGRGGSGGRGQGRGSDNNNNE
jgi:uncharacterized membrane protein YgcG